MPTPPAIGPEREIAWPIRILSLAGDEVTPAPHTKTTAIVHTNNPSNTLFFIVPLLFIFKLFVT
jgi:hypothetical protein